MTDHLTPEVRAAISRLGGLTAAQRCDPHERSRKAAATRARNLYLATDASLSESERQRLVGLALKEQTARATLARAKGRRS